MSLLRFLFGAPPIKKMKARRDIKGLTRALRDDRKRAQRAARALGELGNRRATRPLLGALKSKHEEVRMAAAEAIGAIGDERATEPLLALLQSSRKGVRRAAARALGELGDHRAIAPLSALLQQEEQETRQVIADTLVCICNARAAKQGIITTP